MMYSWVSGLVVFALLEGVAAVGIGDTSVTTDLGIIDGIQRDFNGATLNEFLGVPYAEPPVGERRFARPQPKQPWPTGFTLSAVRFESACPQFPTSLPDGIVMSEDCLFLNIIVPTEAVSARGPLPVMIFIPGEGFRLNAGSEYVGREMAVNGSVIVVTINYRRDVFGFFSTGDDRLPGNYGLWDQRLAIKWVQDNIAAFGGDVSRMTIVGQGREGGTGALSQVLTPLNDNTLFQRAILQSSRADDNINFMRDDKAWLLLEDLAESLNCNSSTWPQQLDCLRSKSWTELWDTRASLRGFFVKPRIDGHFFPGSFDYLIKQDNMRQYDIMAGINSNEALIVADSFGFIDENNIREQNKKVLRNMQVDEDLIPVALETVYDKYADPVRGIHDKASAMRQVFNILNDLTYLSTTVNYLRQHTSSNDRGTYLYFFDYVDDSLVWYTSEFRDGRAGQGEELFYLWDTFQESDTPLADPVNPSTPSVRKNMITYWTNFMHSGDPNVGPSSPSTPPPEWPRFDMETESYVWIKDQTEVGEHLNAEATSFWLDFIIPTFINNDEAEICLADAPIPNHLQVDAPCEDDEDVSLNIVDQDGVRLGEVRGIMEKADEGVGGKRIMAFRGIPYAKPPVGDRRFTHSEILDDWGDMTTLNATTSPPGCLQDYSPLPPFMVPERLDEDCLYLNIFAPEVEQTTTNDHNALPVIVVLPVYEFQRGGSDVAQRVTALACYANALVVTLNCRLGAFGFLSTGDSASPGNYGITDVATALRWIQRFIDSFGGDPESVTVVGWNAGAQIPLLLSLNGLNDGLVHKIVAINDNVLSPISLASTSRDPLPKATELATSLGCPTMLNDELISCLRSMSAEDILSTSSNLSPTTYFRNFYPVIDGAVLKEPADKILESGNFETIPIVVGGSDLDNSIISSAYLYTSETCPGKDTFDALLDDLVGGLYGGRQEVASLLKMFYQLTPLSPVDEIDCETGRQINTLVDDMTVNVPLFEMGRLLSDIYVFSFAHQPSHTLHKMMAEPRIPSWAEQLVSDDTQFALGWPYDQRAMEMTGLWFGPSDRKVSINFMEIISSFAKTGVPSADPSGNSPWLPYDQDDYNALFLDACPEQRQIPRAKEREVCWNTIAEVHYALLGVGVGDGDGDIDIDVGGTSPPPYPYRITTYLGFDLGVMQAANAIDAMVLLLATLGGILLMVLLMSCCVAYSRRSGGKAPPTPSKIVA